MIDSRDELRRAGDYPEADRIRAELLAEGIVVEDRREGTTWHESIWGPGGRAGWDARMRKLGVHDG